MLLKKVISKFVCEFKLFCFYIIAFLYLYYILRVEKFFGTFSTKLLEVNTNGLWSADSVIGGSELRTENTLVPQYVAEKCLAFRSGRL
jgi:hypothetical protein